MLAGVSRDAITPSSSRFSVNSTNRAGKFRNRSPCTGTVSSFLFVFWVSVGSRYWLPSGELLVLRRRLVAGLDVESSVSCVNDVRDVLHLNWKNRSIILEQRSVHSFSVLHWMFLPFVIRCGF